MILYIFVFSHLKNDWKIITQGAPRCISISWHSKVSPLSVLERRLGSKGQGASGLGDIELCLSLACLTKTITSWKTDLTYTVMMLGFWEFCADLKNWCGFGKRYNDLEKSVLKSWYSFLKNKETEKRKKKQLGCCGHSWQLKEKVTVSRWLRLEPNGWALDDHQRLGIAAKGVLFESLCTPLLPHLFVGMWCFLKLQCIEIFILQFSIVKLVSMYFFLIFFFDDFGNQNS